jgi:predicted nucleotide-binding protein
MYLKLAKLGIAPKPLAEAKGTDEKGVLHEPEKKEDTEEKIAPCPPAKVPRVFISHSKNQKIVGQIKQILDFGQFQYVVAEETETTAIPIPDKIFGFMRDCNCAIINISADEQEKRPDGTYGINANVLIEIGGAFLNYDRKVILLVDKRIQLPSNLQGLYRSEYEGDELTFTTAMKLQKALTDFRKR